jgi:hypothetical protein
MNPNRVAGCAIYVFPIRNSTHHFSNEVSSQFDSKSKFKRSFHSNLTMSLYKSCLTTIVCLLMATPTVLLSWATWTWCGLFVWPTLLTLLVPMNRTFCLCLCLVFPYVTMGSSSLASLAPLVTMVLCGLLLGPLGMYVTKMHEAILRNIREPPDVVDGLLACLIAVQGIFYAWNETVSWTDLVCTLFLWLWCIPASIGESPVFYYVIARSGGALSVSGAVVVALGLSELVKHVRVASPMARPCPISPGSAAPDERAIFSLEVVRSPQNLPPVIEACPSAELSPRDDIQPVPTNPITDLPISAVQPVSEQSALENLPTDPPSSALQPVSDQSALENLPTDPPISTFQPVSEKSALENLPADPSVSDSRPSSSSPSDGLADQPNVPVVDVSDVDIPEIVE